MIVEGKLIHNGRAVIKGVLLTSLRSLSMSTQEMIRFLKELVWFRPLMSLPMSALPKSAWRGGW